MHCKAGCGRRRGDSGVRNSYYERLAKESYLRGATSMLGLLISQGMPPEFLDELAEGMRGAKRRMGEGK